MNETNKFNWSEWNKKVKQKKLTDTLKYTYELFLENQDLKKIAKSREFKLETIERQIIELITMGFIHINNVVKKEIQEQIQKQLNKTSSLKQIKQKLPDEITYFEIKSYIASINLNPPEI